MKSVAIICCTLISVYVCRIFANLFLPLQAKAYVTFLSTIFSYYVVNTFFLINVIACKKKKWKQKKIMKTYANIIKSLWFLPKSYS